MLDAYSQAISGIESGGRYGALGPIIPKSGDRAYGKYQVMGANIPVWTAQYAGRRMTPDEFLASPEAQEAVFQGEFGKYVQKYGPEGAARAWFAGERGMNNPNAKDVLGTSVQGYGQKFMAGLGQAPQAPQMPQPAMQQAAPTGGILAQAAPAPQGVMPAEPAPGGILAQDDMPAVSPPRMLQHLPIPFPKRPAQRGMRG